MYRNAIAKKKKGAVIAAAVVSIFAVVLFISALKEPVGWILFGITILFAVLLIFSVIQNSSNIKKMEMKYSGDLEADVNRCNEQVAGKYFFLHSCLADPFNARMIYYSDISSVKVISYTDRRANNHAKHRESRTVNIRTKDLALGSMPIIFNDFNDGMRISDSQTLKNFEDFINMLREHTDENVEFILNDL